MSAARVAIVQFPGVNCEAESARALAVIDRFLAERV